MESKKPNQNTKLVDTENRLVVAGRRWVDKIGEGGQEVQTPGYKMSKSFRM